jgi:hypothetical protein
MFPQIPAKLPPAITKSHDVAEFIMSRDRHEHDPAEPVTLAWRWALTGQGPPPITLMHWNTGPTTARQPDEGTNTNHFVVTDRYADVVSYTNTIEELGGSGIVVLGREFLLNKSQRNSAVMYAKPAFIAAPTTPGLGRLGQSFAIVDTSPLDPTIKISPKMGAASGREFLGHGQILTAAKPVRRGGDSAGVIHPSP